MLEKILELYCFGYDIEEITNELLNLYNKNPYKLWNFNKMNYDQMNSYVKKSIVLFG